jgi:hypothetical protein
VQDATPDAPAPVSLATARAAIDRIDEGLLPALVAALPITTPAGALVEAIRGEAGVSGLSDDVMRPVAEALRSLTPAGAGGEGALRGPGGSAKLAGGEDLHGKGDLERCDACRE